MTVGMAANAVCRRIPPLANEKGSLIEVKLIQSVHSSLADGIIRAYRDYAPVVLFPGNHLFHYLAANHRQRIVMVSNVYVFLRFGGVLFAASFAAAAAPISPEELFDPGRAHRIHIKMSAERWDLLQPGAAAQKASAVTNLAQVKAAGVRLRPGSAAGSYAYVLCDMEFDGKRVADVGLRFKGNSSYSVSATTLRRPMKLDFDRFTEGKRFAGVESFNLSNTSFDPSQVREALAFSRTRWDRRSPESSEHLVTYSPGIYGGE